MRYAMSRVFMVGRFLPWLALLVTLCGACDEGRPGLGALPRPPSCLIADAEIPASEPRSNEPGVFIANECHWLAPCSWVCSHDGLHVVRQDNVPPCVPSDPYRPFMGTTADGGLRVLLRSPQ
jgi:hypothetical protein